MKKKRAPAKKKKIESTDKDILINNPENDLPQDINLNLDLNNLLNISAAIVPTPVVKLKDKVKK